MNKSMPTIFRFSLSLITSHRISRAVATTTTTTTHESPERKAGHEGDSVVSGIDTGSRKKLVFSSGSGEGVSVGSVGGGGEGRAITPGGSGQKGIQSSLVSYDSRHFYLLSSCAVSELCE